MKVAVFIVVPLADVSVDVTLYPTFGGAFCVARELTIEEARALPPSIRRQWELETGLEIGAPVHAWGGKRPTSEGRA